MIWGTCHHHQQQQQQGVFLSVKDLKAHMITTVQSQVLHTSLQLIEKHYKYNDCDTFKSAYVLEDQDTG